VVEDLKKERIQLSYHEKLGPKTKQVLRGITYTNINENSQTNLCQIAI